MITIFTIGTQGMQDEPFIALLKQHGADAVIDIRLRNEGRYYRFASGKHIQALVAANGIAYRHDTRFAPTGELLDPYRSSHDWPAFEQAYRELIQQREMLKIWRVITRTLERPCLLCAEKTADHCHRRLLGEYLAAALGCRLHHIDADGPGLGLV
jgi:uncharacterized protein (DUF488 family)